MTGVLVVVASALLFATAVAVYARRTLFDADAFADRATATLRDERVRTASRTTSPTGWCCAGSRTSWRHGR